MGIKGLLKHIRSRESSMVYAAELELSYLETKYKNSGKKYVVALDFSCLLHTTVTCVRTHSGTDLKNKFGVNITWLVGICQKLTNLLSHYMNIIVVFDGKSSHMKDKEKDKRKEIKNNKLAEIELIEDKNSEEFKKKYAQTYSPTEEEFDLAKQLMHLLGIPYIQAVAEADPVCAWLNKNNYVDAVISEDSDMLALGAKIMFTNSTRFIKDEKVFVYNLAKTLNNWGMSHEEFIAFCVLCGTDYNKNLPGIGPAIACKKIKEVGSLNKFLKRYIDEHDITDEIESIIEDIKKSYDYFINYDKTDEFIQFKKNIKKYDLKMKRMNVKGLENFLFVHNNLNQDNTYIYKFMCELWSLNEKFQFPPNDYQYEFTKDDNIVIKTKDYFKYKTSRELLLESFED